MYHVSNDLSLRKRTSNLPIIKDNVNAVDTISKFNILDQDPKFQLINKQIKQIVDELIEQVIVKISPESQLPNDGESKKNQKSFPGTALFTNKSITSWY